jgi:hypothetical protein
VACLGWGSAAWSVKSRDAFIDWDKKTKEQRLHFVANNVRFLLLPWVKVNPDVAKNKHVPFNPSLFFNG